MKLNTPHGLHMDCGMKINTIKKIIGVSVLAAIISFAGCSGESGNTPGQGAESEVEETDKNEAVDTSEPVDDKLSKQEDSTESEAGEMPEEAEEEPTTKTCPHCQMEIPIAATKCGHCTSDLEE